MKEEILLLTTMDDSKKRVTMEFRTLLLTFCIFSSPLLMHLASCRMIQLTFQHGFYEDSISGLCFISHGMHDGATTLLPFNHNFVTHPFLLTCATKPCYIIQMTFSWQVEPVEFPSHSCEEMPMSILSELD